MEVKVTIKVKNIEIKDLTLDEVKELRDILSKIVDKDTIKEKEYIPYPYIVEPYPCRWWKPIVTWDGTSYVGGSIEDYPNITVTYLQ